MRTVQGRLRFRPAQNCPVDKYLLPTELGFFLFGGNFDLQFSAVLIELVQGLLVLTESTEPQS